MLAPGPKGSPIVGHLPERRRDPLGLFTRSAREFGDVVRFQMGPRTLILVTRPEHVHHVLVGNARNYVKSFGYDKIEPLVGKGLLTSEGDFWRRQRKLAQPAFHRPRLAAFARTMVDCTDAMLRNWDAPARSGVPLDLAAEMMRLTLNIVARTLLSADVEKEAAAVGHALTEVLHEANERVVSFFDLTEKLPTPRNLRFKRNLAVIDRVVLEMIGERRKSGVTGNDLLGMLMEVKDEDTGETMSDRQLRDEAMTIFMAGHETTANSLAWTFALLSRHPEIARKVKAEIDRVLPDGRAPGVEDLEALSYTEQVIQESLRLYPPAWIFGRQPLEADEVGGYTLPKGVMVGISPYVIHRRADLWENPEGFDPDRFAPGAPGSETRHKMAYLPFGGGPRVCIGNGFAMMEMQLLLARILQKFRPDLLPGIAVEPEPSITLRPRNGVNVILSSWGQVH